MLDHLEDNICRVIADIRPQMLEKVIENWTSRLDYIRACRGSHMPEIIIKIFEPHSSEETTPDLQPHCPNIRNISTGDLGFRQRFKVHQPFYTVDLQLY
ncbi:hypothetical protein TNCV_3589811 [Trichonephila clavipes]|nr:hypothetical protein TNCV_3589811 [Trichonephila clavipes]